MSIARALPATDGASALRVVSQCIVGGDDWHAGDLVHWQHGLRLESRDRLGIVISVDEDQCIICALDATGRHPVEKDVLLPLRSSTCLTIHVVY